MSVIKFSKEEWQEFFNSLYHLQRRNDCGRLYLFSKQEIKYYANIDKKATEEEILKEMTAWFVRKLAMINELAFAYNYYLDRDKSYKMNPCIEFDDPSSKILSDKYLFIRIGSIKYNCVSNGGSNLLPKEILEKLDRIQLNIGYNFIDEGD